MQPANCPNWEYIQHPKHKVILKRKTIDILVKLRTLQIDSAQSAIDSRAIHQYLFSDLTPENCKYFAGHYRGEDFRCLKSYHVGIKGDWRVGLPPQFVAVRMQQLSETIERGILALDAAHTLPHSKLSQIDKLLNTVTFASLVFEKVLQIHPYANGNGHAARFIVWAILGRYGYWPKRFPIDPRPSDASYIDSIIEYRNGNRQPLEEYLLKCIIGESGTGNTN